MLAKVFAERIKEQLIKFPENIRKDVVIMFSAHSLPLKAVNRGDNYPGEVASSVHATIAALKADGIENPYQLVWQSKVGPLPWLQPYTDDAIKVFRNEMFIISHEYLLINFQAYVKQGKKNLILVPIAFVNEHIETLHEMDIEYCHDLGKEVKYIYFFKNEWIKQYFFYFYQVGVQQIERASAPNDHPLFIEAISDLVQKHLNSGKRLGAQFTNRYSIIIF